MNWTYLEALLLSDRRQQCANCVFMVADDFGWDPAAKALVNDVSHRFSIRVDVDDWELKTHGSPGFSVCHPVEWLTEVRDAFAEMFSSYYSRFGVEIRYYCLNEHSARAVPAVGHRGEMEFVNEIGEVEVSNSHRFLIPPNGMPCKSLVEREFNLRFDFTLSTDQAAELRLRLSAWPFRSSWPAAWPTTAPM